jgi:uncharacterized protein YutE (UPF0331/DUF86 family)
MVPGLISQKIAAAKLQVIAGYRNRMIHEYDVVTPPELYRILTERRVDIEEVVACLRSWLADRPDRMDNRL